MRNQSRYLFRSLFRVKVNDPKSGALIGYVGDVSENGLRVLSDTAFAPGTTATLQLRMRVNENETLQFELDVGCRWSGSNAKTGYFEAGFMLERPSAEFTRMVDKMRVKRVENEGGV
ncbi:MAG TPA: PilZ domain-containing protein [Dongiaceae bacterium]|nr:PilZ domain-containing protein [Dongiaceae bacterium]